MCICSSPRLGLAMLSPRPVSLRELVCSLAGITTHKERVNEPRNMWGCYREWAMRQDWTELQIELPQALGSEAPADGTDFPAGWGHLRAISNSSGSSMLSFCMAMSAMGPRITTGRLKLAVGRGQTG